MSETTEQHPSLAVQLGRLLTHERERKGKSRRKFAQEAGVADVTLLMYERGSENPTLAKAEELAETYGLELTITARRKRR